MGLSLRRNIVWIFVGQSVYAACQWALFATVARLGGVEMAGTYALALAITAPIVIFSQLQLRQMQVADTAGAHPFADYLAVRLTLSLAALAAIAAVVGLGGYRGQMAEVILAVGLAKAVESLSDVYYGLEQRHERLDLVAKSLMARGLSALVALSAGLHLSGRLVVGVLAMAAAWALVWALHDHPVTRAWRQQSRARDPGGTRAAIRRRRLRLAWTGLPLGITLVLVSLNTNVPRYFIEGHLGREALGSFAAMAYFVVAGGMIVNALGQAASPRLANTFARGETGDLRRLLGRVMLAALALGAAGILLVLVAGPELLTLFYGPAFARDADLFVWVMVAAAVSYLVSPLGYAITAMRVFRPQPLFLALVLAVNLLGCALLVPTLGLAGAVAAWTAALLVQGLLYALAVRRRLHAADVAAAGRLEATAA